MSDQDRIVFPDEVEQVKAEAAEKQKETEKEESNEVQAPVEEAEIQGIQMRNVIIAPGNCPPGFKRGADGVCREVF